MAICKWCECDAELNRHGYCESCNASVREDIKKHIAALTELTERAAPFLPDDEKTAIHKTMLEEYEILKGYKAKKVTFFKSDIEVLRANVIKKLGMGAEAVPPSAELIAKRNKYAFIILIEIIIAVVAVFVLISVAMNKSNDPNNPKNQAIFLMTVAQSAVKEQLKSPSSAKFAWDIDDYVISKDKNIANTYVVSSFVDAQNAFGASIRSIFVVKLEVDFVTQKYRVLDIAID